MASYNVHTILVVLFVFGLVEIGSSLNCYNCTKVNDPNNCKDPFDKEHASKMQCLAEQVCVKHIAPSANLDVTDQSPKILAGNIVRGCKPKGFCKSQNVEKFTEFCNECAVDLCNSSSAVMPSFFVIALYMAKRLIF